MLFLSNTSVFCSGLNWVWAVTATALLSCLTILALLSRLVGGLQHPKRESGQEGWRFQPCQKENGGNWATLICSESVCSLQHQNLLLHFSWPAQIRDSPWVLCMGHCSWSYTSVNTACECMHAGAQRSCGNYSFSSSSFPTQVPLQERLPLHFK